MNSSVLVWPDRQVVVEAAGRWAADLASVHQDVLAVGCFSSYARDTAGVDSDLDLTVYTVAWWENLPR